MTGDRERDRESLFCTRTSSQARISARIVRLYTFVEHKLYKAHCLILTLVTRYIMSRIFTSHHARTLRFQHERGFNIYNTPGLVPTRSVNILSVVSGTNFKRDL